MSEGAFSGTITFTTDDDGNRRIGYDLSQPVTLIAHEVFTTEDGSSDVYVQIVPPDTSETETHFLEGDDGDGLEIETLGLDDDDEGADADTPLAAEGNVHALPH